MDDEEAEKLIAEEYCHISEVLSFDIPPVQVDTVTQPLGYGATDANFREIDLGPVR